MQSSGKTHIRSLDALRGFAAFIVVAFHLYHLGGLKLPESATILIAKHGSLGVQWFFVLSAFCMSLGYYDRINTPTDLKRFVIRRIFRIVPLYYVMLIIWVVTTNRIYGTTHSPAQLVLNSVFLVNILSLSGNGIVWAGWTLGVEAAFYLAFPVMIAFLRGVVSSAIALAVSLAVGLSFMVELQSGGIPSETSWATYTPQVPFFVAGILSYHVFRRLDARPDNSKQLTSNLLLGFAVMWIFAVFSLHLYEYRIFDVYSVGYSIGVGFALITVSQALSTNFIISNRVTVYLGECGYSLYLLHPFVILMATPFIHTWVYSENTRDTPSLTRFLISFLIVAAVTSLASAVTYEMIEKRGNDLGRRLTRNRT